MLPIALCGTPDLGPPQPHARTTFFVGVNTLSATLPKLLFPEGIFYVA